CFEFAKFRNQRSKNIETVPSTLLNFFGWLATFNVPARRRVIELYPTLLMETGDPNRISADDRKLALRAHAATYQDRVSRGQYFYDADLVAFSSSDLSETVSDLLNHAQSPELKEHLLEVARCGKIQSAADHVCAIATDLAESLRVRTEALSALVEIGSAAHLQTVLPSVLRTIEEAGEVSPDAAGRWNEFLLVAATLIAAHDDNVTTVSPLLEALARERRNGGSIAGRAGKALIEHLPAAKQAEWFNLIFSLLVGERSGDFGRLPQCHVEKLCLLPAMALLIRQRVEAAAGANFEPEWLMAIEALCGLTYDHAPYRYEREIEECFQVLLGFPAIKAEMIEHRWHVFKAEPPKMAWQVIHAVHADRTSTKVDLWHGDDVVELLRRAESSTEDRWRERYFYTALHLMRELHRDQGREPARQALIQYARKSNNRSFKRAVVPRWPNWFWNWRYQHGYKYTPSHIRNFFPGYVRRSAWGLYVRYYNRAYRLIHARETARGKTYGILARASRHYPSDDKDKGVRNNLAQLNVVYSKRFSRRAAEGYRALWRLVEPGLPLPWGDSLIEAAGLGVELDSNDGCATAAEREAAQAATIAFSLWGGAPDWVSSWLPQWVSVFQDVARPAIARELRLAHSRPSNGGETVRSIAFGPPELAAGLTDTLVDELLKYPDAPIETLRLILSLALQHGCAERISADRLKANIGMLAAEGRFSNAFLWLEFWIRTDPVAAWQWVAPWFGIWTRDGTSPFLSFLAGYGDLGRRYADAPPPSDKFEEHPEVLGELLKATFQIADPRTDDVYEDGCSPNARDNAQDARRGWIQKMAQMKSREA
ncbi:MAG: hypothetical protein AAGJ50_09885, partial [Pseudomonadota bacterium]